jgi:hypothetical protein
LAGAPRQHEGAVDRLALDLGLDEEPDRQRRSAAAVPEEGVVDAGGRARHRAVEVLRERGEEVVISAGLDDGDRVIVSPLDDAVDGMRVRLAGAVEPPAAEPAPADGDGSGL